MVTFKINYFTVKGRHQGLKSLTVNESAKLKGWDILNQDLSPKKEKKT